VDPTGSPDRYTHTQILIIACELGGAELVELLLNDDRIDVNAILSRPSRRKYTVCLHISAAYGYLECFQLFMAHPGVDIYKKNGIGYNALHIALIAGRSNIVQYILDDINRGELDAGKNTALHFAADKGCLSSIQHLLNDARVNPNLRNRSGQTALYFASIKRSPEILKLLVNDPRLDPNVRNSSKSTPIHFAAANGRVECVRTLLRDVRVDPNMADVHGWHAVRFAKQYVYANVVKLIRSDPRVVQDQEI
jgi:ankyrin repeat protein